jgi:mono/diheme cytochrome c family protein/glucose/arabinose dehydrogenase
MFLKKLFQHYSHLSLPLRIGIMLVGFLGIGFIGGGLYYYKKIYDRSLKYKITAEDRLSDVYFDQVNMEKEASGVFTSLVIAPDHKLYATGIDGVIKRFTIQKDGSLVLFDSVKPFQDTKRLLMGLTFSPDATVNNLVAWITYHDFAGLEGAPHWDARIAKLTFSPTTDSVNNELVITNLPRSAKDHLTNGLAFGTDGALYVNQGCMTWMGRSCRETGVKWDEGRDETLLAGTVLRLDLNKLPTSLPLDVKTIDGGGAYNPYASDAPLTIYATGVRNAYDLVWHTNGRLYIAVNGSSDGGCTPTSNPNDKNYLPPLKGITYEGRKDVPAIDNVADAQEDFLLEIQQGKYYGQPNPIRAEYVLNRGEIDITQAAYKGMTAEKNYAEPLFSFGKHSSPTGTIEYKSNTFDGKLKGMLVVARYNMYSDVVLVQIDEQTQKVSHFYDGSKIGLGNIYSPLDVVEDTQTGNLYISQYGVKSKITLCKPSVKGRQSMANEAKKDSLDDGINEQNVTVLTAKEDIDKGKNIYLQNCAVCHGEKGQGLIAPNLTDQYWIHGNSVQQIYKVIRKGVLEKGMQGWEGRLLGKEIQQISSYILTLQGSNPPDAKAPEGEKY